MFHQRKKIYSFGPKTKIQFSLFEEPNGLNFDKTCIKYTNIHDKKTNISKLVIKYIFITKLIRNINANNISYKVGQT